MPQWRKLWTKTTESLDLNDMPDDFHRLLWLMLPLFTCSEGRGLDNAAWIKAKAMPLRMDVSPEMIGHAMCWYADHGMIVRYEVDGRSYFQIHNWHKYQGDTSREAPSDYPSVDDGKVKTNSRPTHDLLTTGACSDADADAEEIQIESGDPPDFLPDMFEIPIAQLKGHRWNKPQYQQMLEAEQSRGDACRSTLVKWLEGKLGVSQHPAVQVYAGHVHQYPVKVWAEKVATAVGEDGTALELWDKVIVGWLGCGWNPQNVQGMLEFYDRREVPSSKPNGKPASPPPARGVAKGDYMDPDEFFGAGGQR